MQIARTNNAIRNIFFGSIFRTVSVLFPFFVRTAILYRLGSDYLGLSSLFTSILSFLSLAELGVGTALVYCMYKPIAEDNKEEICALLNLYRTIYRYIGAAILAIGMLFVPFLKYLVKDSCPADVNLYVLYFIYLINTTLSYWMFAYKQSLLIAHQRTDMISKRSIIIQTIMYLIQIVILLVSKNYYLYILCMPVATVVTNVANSIIVDRMYPNYSCVGEVSKEVTASIKKKTVAMFGTKANSIVMHAADNIVISTFLGLSVVGVYGNYYYIMSAVIGMMTIIYESLTAGIGNSMVLESKQKNYHDFEVLGFLNAWLVMFCTVSLFCLYQPFMTIWVHGNPDYILSNGMVVLLAVYFYVYQIRRIGLTYKDAAGIWWEDRYRPYVMMIVNLVGNIVMVQIIGLYGVVLSTIISMAVSLPWETKTLFTFAFERSSLDYYKRLAKYACVTILGCCLTFAACACFSGEIGSFLIKCALCLIIPNLFFAVAFCKDELFAEALKKIKRTKGNHYGTQKN